MFSLTLTCGGEDRDLLIAGLWECGTAGITESPEALEAFFEQRLPELEERFAAWKPVWREHVERDWTEGFRQSWPALAVGRRSWLAAPWDDTPAPAGRIRIDYRPAMACGTGAHPCTQLCLEALEETVRPGGTVFDVGCGSGILSVAAILLGAGRVIACDLDPQAVPFARAAFLETGREPAVFLGSGRAVRDHWAGTLAANINGLAAAMLRDEFARVLKPDGTLIVSGFRAHDAPDYGRQVRVLERDGWLCYMAPAAVVRGA